MVDERARLILAIQRVRLVTQGTKAVTVPEQLFAPFAERETKRCMS